MSLNRYRDEVFYVAASLLMSIDSFRSIIASLKCSCGKPCVINTFIELSRNVSNYSARTVNEFNNAVINYLQLSNQYDDSNDRYDPIDIVSAVLVNFHCLVATRTCYKNEESARESCYDRCPLHNIFYLGVKEIYSCKCGDSYESFWEQTNVCQFFNTSGIFEGFDIERSSALSRIPKEVLVNAEFGNYEGFLNSISIKLKERLEGANVETCQNDECEIKESSVMFEVINAPKVFMIDLIWDDDPNSVSCLNSFLSTIGLKKSLKILDIYLNGIDNSYTLNQIIFNRGDLFKIAKSKGQYWEMEGLHNQASWEDLLNEITLHRLHPISAIYLESSSNNDFNLSKVQLLKIEQKAVQCDNFTVEFGRSCIDEDSRSTGFFKELKKIKPVAKDANVPSQISSNSAYRDHGSANARIEVDQVKNIPKDSKLTPQSSNNLVNRDYGSANARIEVNEIKNTYIDSKLAPQSSNNLVSRDYGSANARIEVDQVKNIPKEEKKVMIEEKKIVDRMQKSNIESNQEKNKKLPSEQGWICENCNKINKEEANYMCENCGKFEMDRYNRFKKTPQVQKNLYEPEQKPSPKPNSNLIKATNEIKVEIWECDCGTSNMPDFLVCTNCYSLKPGVTGWVCNNCKTKNEETGHKCLSCGSYKDSSRKPVQEFWICDKCKTAIIKGIDFCEKCHIEKRGTRNIPAEVQDYLKCPTCKKDNPKTYVKCLWCDTKFSTPEKARIEQNLREENKKVVDKNEWACEKCKYKNSENSKWCRSCYEDKPNQDNRAKIKAYSQVETRNPETTNQAILKSNFWVCSSCDAANRIVEDRCYKCKAPKEDKKIESPTKKNTQNERSNLKREYEVDTIEWVCLSCNKMNSSSRKYCIGCYAEKPGKSNTSMANKRQDTLICRTCKKEIINVICDCTRTVPIANKKCTICSSDLTKKVVCSDCDYAPAKVRGYNYVGRHK